jgi:hypothetical protein
LQEKTVTKNSKLSNIVFLLFFLSIAIAICFNVIDEVLEINKKSLVIFFCCLATRKINTKEMPKILTRLDQPRRIKNSPELMCVDDLGAICPRRVTGDRI